MRERASVALLSALVALACTFGCARDRASAAHYGLGHDADSAALAAIDIDVAPDGRGLPIGHGDAATGASLFAARCASCHGQAIRLAPNRWPYATTVFDYVRRAMPPNRVAPLSANEVYSLVAYELYMNGISGEHGEMNRTTLPATKMPGIKLFVEH